jgi:hypothetical protein
MTPQRNQIKLRVVDLDALLTPDHAARTVVWAFVQSMDLAPLYERIKSVAGRGGAPAIDPAILVALWLWRHHRRRRFRPRGRPPVPAR